MSANASESGPDANRLTATATSFSTAGTRRTEHPPPVIPDHEVLRLIGRGSYGEVWLARTTLGSLHAVKVVYRESFDHDRPYEREFEGIKKFEPISHARESQVDIFHVGRNDEAGFFYYTMELADDANAGPSSHLPGDNRASIQKETGGTPVQHYTPRTLKHEFQQRGALPVAECVPIALSLVRALEHLHGHGLVHRDIKPSNIIFVHGVPKLADIGLVTNVDATRSFVGTVGYIPPEGPGTPQADLYSLGKVLYECITGKDRLDFPELPADWRASPDFEQLLEFNEILTKACDAQTQSRYQSATAMLLELECLQGGGSVKKQRQWQRSLIHAKNLALALAVLAVVAVIAYSIALRQKDQSSFKKSPVPEANEEYHLGLIELHTTLNAEEAIKHFEKATQLDPHFADAYAQLADAFFSIPDEASNAKARSAAAKAMQLDPQSGLAHVFFAGAKGFTLDFRTAEKECQLAVKLSPNSEEVLLTSALILSNLGRTNEALANLQRALSLGQDTPSKLRELYSAYVCSYCRQYDRAIAIYNAASWLDTRKRMSELADIYLLKGEYMKSLRLGREAALAKPTQIVGQLAATSAVGVDADQVNAEFDALEKAFKAGGPDGYWRRRLGFETPRSGGDHLMIMAAIHARLHETKDALDYLRRAMQETPAYVVSFFYPDPSFDSLRNETGFRDLEEQLWKEK